MVTEPSFPTVWHKLHLRKVAVEKFTKFIGLVNCFPSQRLLEKVFLNSFSFQSDF